MITPQMNINTLELFAREATKEAIDEIFSNGNSTSNSIFDFSKLFFSPDNFDYFFGRLEGEKTPKIILNKSFLNKKQINKILELTNSNKKKGMTVCAPDGAPFGPVYTDYSTYYAEKKCHFIKELESAQNASNPISSYADILNETTAKALLALLFAMNSKNTFPKATEDTLKVEEAPLISDILTEGSFQAHQLKSLRERMELLPSKLRVIDFGSGEGKDSIPLLRILNLLQLGENLKLAAIDADVQANADFESILTQDEKQQVEIYTGPFMEFELKEGPADLLFSSFTWPYRPSRKDQAQDGSSDFDQVWEKTKSLIRDEGIIAGHLFGMAKTPNCGMTYHTEEEVIALLEKDFEILWFYSEKEDGIKPNGQAREVFGGKEPAWGELYHFVARRKVKINHQSFAQI